ncbi:hypothetical protein H1R20_g9067, partial [Candolleomyces eurysporus]
MALQVGLFASVVATFIVDARRDIQVETEQSLLKDIRDSPSTPTVAHISRSAISIHILWLLSLQMTLFVAVVGVLAKHWLTRYAPGTTKPRTADGAYRRFRLDKQARFVETAITHVPLIFQTHVVSLTFLVGLTVWTFNDNQTVGWVLLTCLLAGIVTYLVMPLFRSLPFNTPLYDFTVWLKTRRDNEQDGNTHSRQDGGRNKNGKNEVLFKILCQMFRSLKSEHVEEAAAEIVLPSFKQEWIGRLCEQGIPSDLLSRIGHCASARTGTPEARIVILRNYLHAFLRFVEYFEDKLDECAKSTPQEKKSKIVSLIKRYPQLPNTFRESLDPVHPVHRSANLHEGLTPLLFGLRVHVLVILQSNPEVFQINTDTTHPEFDFQSEEMPDRPSLWELALWEIHTQDRFYLMLSACRGVIQGQKKAQVN